MSLNAYQKACAGFFVLITIYWIVLFASGSKEGVYNSLFAFLYGLVPLLGGAFAMVGYRTWGGLSTVLGKAILLFGSGLFFWGCGQITWMYYVLFLGVEVPYPSLADFFFLPGVFFYTLGTIYLSMTTGARFALKERFGKVYAVSVPLVALAVTYVVIIIIGKGGELVSEGSDALKTVLDIAYPLGDAVSLSVAGVVAGLSFRYLGGLYKYEIVSILVGLAVMFMADSVFSYTTTVGTAYNGSLGDYIFALGTFLLTFGILGFNKIRRALAPAD